RHPRRRPASLRRPHRRGNGCGREQRWRRFRRWPCTHRRICIRIVARPRPTAAPAGPASVPRNRLDAWHALWL
ncbi:hypothetical protein LPJ57_007488, partial [Coemansia sp. RSA 486]